MNQREAIRDQRAYLLQKSLKTTIIKKGDNRITSATRFCAICKRPLSKLILNTGATVSTAVHYSIKLSDVARVNMCADIRSCYSNLENEAEGD